MKYSIIGSGSSIFIFFSQPFDMEDLIKLIEKIAGVTAHVDSAFQNKLVINRDPYVTLRDIRQRVEYWLKSNCEEFEYVEAYS